MGTFAQLAAGIPYGHRVMFALSIEGVEPIFTEYEVGKGVTNRAEGAGLLILDGSAAIGSKIDRRTGIGAGFDLGVTIRRGSAIDSLVNAPSVVTRLTADLDYTDTTIEVDSTTGFASSGIVYIGREAIGYSATTATTFTVDTRGIYGPKAETDGKAYDHPFASSVSTWVTDRPLFWRGREATLWAVPVDPFGACHSSDLLADAAMVWRGFIASDVETGRDGYTFKCRSLDRRLAEELVSGFSAKALARLQDDGPVAVDTSLTLRVLLESTVAPGTTGGTFNADFQIQPFAASYSDGDVISAHKARREIRDAVKAELSSYGYADDARWTAADIPQGGGGVIRQYLLQVAMEGVSATVGDNVARLNVDVMAGHMPAVVTNPPGINAAYATGGIIATQVLIPQTPNYVWLSSDLAWRSQANLTGFDVVLDGADPGSLPPSGWIVLEIGPDEVTYQYDSIDANGATVRVHLVEDSGPPLSELEFEKASDVLQEITCRFVYRDQGQIPTLMRRMVMSSGRGDNDATYDALPVGAGYDIANVDTASFDAVFDGAWLYMTADLAIDDGASFGSLFGGLAALSSRAVVSRPSADGSTVEIAAVRTSLYDTADVAATITDAELVRASQGRSPVRRLDRVRMPNAIKAVSRVGADEFSVLVNDVTSQRAEGRESWDVDAPGVPRAALEPAARTWGRALFSDRFGVQAYELDVAPWVDVRTGDPVALSLTHFASWDREAGAIGYTGTARVIGRRVALGTGVQTLTVLAAGRLLSMSLSPAAAVVAVDNATAPTLVTVSDDFLGLLTAFDGEAGTFDLVAYLPSASSTGAGYSRLTCSAIAHDAANNEVDITVDSYTSSPNITTAWYITTPLASTANAKQDQHMRTDSDAYWR